MHTYKIFWPQENYEVPNRNILHPWNVLPLVSQQETMLHPQDDEAWSAFTVLEPAHATRPRNPPTSIQMPEGLTPEVHFLPWSDYLRLLLVRCEIKEQICQRGRTFVMRPVLQAIGINSSPNHLPGCWWLEVLLGHTDHSDEHQVVCREALIQTTPRTSGVVRSGAPSAAKESNPFVPLLESLQTCCCAEDLAPPN